MLAETYIRTVTEKIAGLDSQIDSIKSAAGKVVECALGGGRVFVADPSGIIDAELTNRASGLALFRRYFSGRTKTTTGDILIMFSLTADNEAALAMLETAHESGASSIVVAPAGAVAEAGQMALVNNTDIANGVLELSGIGKAFCPISGITNAAIGWAIVAETMAAFIAADKKPTVLWGEHLKGGREKRIEARRQLSSQGY